MTDETTNPLEEIARLADGDAAPSAAPPQPPVEWAPEWEGADDEPAAPIFDEAERRSIDLEAVKANAAEPQNDTGNGQRLIRHFGPLLINVREIATDREMGWHVYDGKRWQREGGNEFALLCAQRTAPRIQLEANYIEASPLEKRAIDEAEEAHIERERLEAKPRDQWTDADKKRMQALERTIATGDEALDAVKKRQLGRRKFAVSSGNGARLREMMKQAAPHKTVAIADLDKDPLAFNCANGTLRFECYDVPDLECPDPAATRTQPLWVARLDPHDPADMISKLSPVDFKPEAKAPKFLASLERFQPSAEKRRWLQKYHGYALTGKNGEQCVLFNYGGGANWKSTFTEAVARVMGEYAAFIKFESLADVGTVTGAQANPDFARLVSARFVRTSEVERGVPVKQGLIKQLTSGEVWSTRHNFGNFFDFYPIFKLAMPGNTKPEIQAADHGMKRRIRFVIWPVQITEEERRPIEEVLAELWEEREGILAWLVEGALAYLNEGLKPPPEIVEETAEYQEEMDPIGGFDRDCVTHLEEQPGVEDPPFVAAAEMYDAYVAWCDYNGVRAWQKKAFGGALTQKGFRRSRKPGQRRYIWVRLHDVPHRRGHESAPHPADAADKDDPI